MYTGKSVYGLMLQAYHNGARKAHLGPISEYFRMGLTNEISMSYCRDISRGKRPGEPKQKETKMSNAQIALKPVLVADLHIGSEIDGLPLIEKFTDEGNEFYDEWVTTLHPICLSERMLPLSTLARLRSISTLLTPRLSSIRQNKSSWPNSQVQIIPLDLIIKVGGLSVFQMRGEEDAYR